MDTQEDLESTQAELETVQSSLAETHLELQNNKAALANSERARQAANRDRVLPRPHGKQEIFVVFKFQNPQELPIGRYRLFAVQRNAVNGAIKQFKTKNPELDAVEIEELRFDRSPRGENVYQQMKYDNAAPIKFSRRNFILKDGKTEEEMITYIRQIFGTFTQENSTASTAGLVK
ncbi:hypothetical protein BGX26_007513 [Mortierella sp. AD094]|nr:hypothetical protein BGX26_007513 [Mortierella sp. AD094]